MFFLPTVSLLVISLGLAQAAPGAPGLEHRHHVSDAVALLVAAKESAFCSSVLGLKDVTITKTLVGPASHITVTDPAAPCTKTAPANTLTSTSVVTLPAPVVSTTTTLVASTSSSFVYLSASTIVRTLTLPAVTETTSVTLPVSTSTASATVTPAPVSTTITVTSTSLVTTTITSYAINSVSNKRAAAPNLKDLPPILELELFACDIIEEACSIYVRPKTQTTTKTLPGSTYTSHTLPPSSCTTVTPSVSETTITSTVTPSSVTSVATFTPPISQVTSTISPPAVTVTTTTQLPNSSTSVTITPPATVVTSTITLPASTTTSTTTSTSLATSTIFDLGTTNTDNDCKAGSTPYNTDIPGATGSLVVTCNAFSGNPFGPVATKIFNKFTDCVNDCVVSACDAIDWNIETGECFEYDGYTIGAHQNYGYNHMDIVINLG